MDLELIKEEMAMMVRSYNAKGWSEATSTNYSFKTTDGQIWVSRSGVDKSQFTANDFITVDTQGNSCGEYQGVRPSAETLIHCILYQLYPNLRYIVHAHGLYAVVLSSVYEQEISFEGFEIQKGFWGQTTHEARVSIPIFDNDQDMSRFAEVLKANQEKLNNGALIMRKHGSYAWGTTLLEAKRHLETLEYLCQAEYLRKAIL